MDQVPNQPLVFTSDPQKIERFEDSLIAWTWKQFLEDISKVEWPARLPMTKAVVRAMDTIETFTKTYEITINKFVIAGASKRGWTVWTTAAVDKRVVGMIPIVMPVGNLDPLLNTMFRVYGEWSYVLKDYIDAEVMGYLGKPEIYNLGEIIDPMMYYDRYSNINKYVVSACGDEFFLPDSTRFFWDLIPQPKILLMAPNTDHHMLSIPIFELLKSIQAFYQSILSKVKLPDFQFELIYSNTTASIKAFAKGPHNPTSVYLWKANTLSFIQRDFRAHTCSGCINPVIWTKSLVEETFPGSRKWEVSVTSPIFGWTGFLLKATYDIVKEQSLEITTSVNIVPDMLPYESCQELKECQPKVPWNPELK